jgi:hypothetical protein
MPRRYRDFVLPLLQTWVENNGCCPPQAPEGAVTSVARRWSRHTNVKMRRATPHPRPWEGQIVSFDGLFLGVDRTENL